LRFKGLVSRNTLTRWLEEGKLRPSMTDKTSAPYVFRREVLDSLAEMLSESHDQRIRRRTKSEVEFQRIRNKVRADCLQTLISNDCAEFGKSPHLARHERDPALSDGDAMGATELSLPKITITTYQSHLKKGDS
jgi:hypothetical protein